MCLTKDQFFRVGTVSKNKLDKYPAVVTELPDTLANS